MNQHQTAAYGALHDAADKLNGLLSAARSNQHPLTLPESAVTAISEAVQALFTAQREIERTRIAQERRNP